jgi:ABC-type lipoprotein export system ATPase subunit/ABC-type antimicrobial peptide transport system permease subunit
MNQNLFDIQNLVCSYSGDDSNKVLSIDKLSIPRGKLVFLLGASGCGKSTLLETLGLMNDTVVGGSITFHPDDVPQQVDLPALWNQSNEGLLNDIRRKHYSFIFQNTNLMENFTAYENVCLSGMIKENVSQEKILDDARQLMDKVKLFESEVDLSTVALNLSGGQRQRLAFVRALNNKATVLFGDEPTGNLDEANANELFEIIKSNLGRGLSAIVVSHDINLAVKHADEIVVITKDPAKGYGEVLAQNIFSRQQWQQFSEKELTTFRQKLRSFYHAGNEHVVAGEAVKAKVDTSLGYKQLFFRKEGAVLFGKRALNLGVLFLILFFTFLAIGFANGGLYYLNKVLSSPFVQWITIRIPMSRGMDREEMSTIKYEISLPEVKDKFMIGELALYSENSISVFHYSKPGDPKWADGRTINYNADRRLLLEDILGQKNLVKGSKAGFRNEMDFGLIVKRQFMEELGYPKDARQLYLEITSDKDSVTGEHKMEKVPVPIRAVVEELPGKYQVIYTDYFIWALTRATKSPFRLDDEYKLDQLFYNVSGRQDDKDGRITKLLNQFLDAHIEYHQYGPQLYVTSDTLGYEPGLKIEIGLSPGLDSKSQMDTLAAQVAQYLKENGVKNQLDRFYNFESSLEENPVDPNRDAISIYFTSLDRIREFEQYLKKSKRINKIEGQSKIEMDINQVREKENFNFLSNVTKIIATLLVSFSTLAIMLFVFNLLKSHLSKVRMNIGTFKALGLQDREARNIYFGIILAFVVSGIVFAFVLSGLTGYLLNAIMKRNLVIDKDIDYFRLFDWKTLLAILVIVSSSLITSWITIKRLLNKTPGDLIYNR